MSLYRLIPGAALAVLLAACSSHPAPQDAASPATPATASTALPASNPLAPLLNTPKRVQKEVQQDIKAHDAAQRKALKDDQQ